MLISTLAAAAGWWALGVCLTAGLQAQREACAVMTLRDTGTAQATYHSRRGDFGTLAQIAPLFGTSATDYDQQPGLGTAVSPNHSIHGYYYRLTVVKPDGYFIVAIPVHRGDRSYYDDEDGVMYECNGGCAVARDSHGHRPAAGWEEVGG